MYFLQGSLPLKTHATLPYQSTPTSEDDPDAIIDMVRAFNDGKEIVYGVRSDRSTDSWFKRSSAHLFYLIQQKMGVDTVYDHADFRLMSRRAIEMLGRYGESNLFLRGIIPQIGLETAKVAYRRHPRAAGESKYPFFKMLNFSVDGITSFSAKPIRWIFTTGLILLGLDILVAVWVLVSYFSGHIIRWLGFYNGIALVSWKSHSDVDRDSRGVYWQNLHGSEETPQI